MKQLLTWLKQFNLSKIEWEDHAYILKVLYRSYDNVLTTSAIVAELQDARDSCSTVSARKVGGRAIRIAQHLHRLQERYANQPDKLYRYLFGHKLWRPISVRTTALALILTLPEDVFVIATESTHAVGVFMPAKRGYPIISLNTGNLYSSAIHVLDMFHYGQHEFTHAVFDQLYNSTPETFPLVVDRWQWLGSNVNRHQQYAAQLSDWACKSIRSELIAYAQENEFDHSLEALSLYSWWHRLLLANETIAESGLPLNQQKKLYSIYFAAYQQTLVDIEKFLRLAQHAHELYHKRKLSYYKYLSILLLVDFPTVRRLPLRGKPSLIYKEIRDWSTDPALVFHEHPPTLPLKKLRAQATVTPAEVLRAVKKLPRNLSAAWYTVNTMLYKHCESVAGLPAVIYTAQYSADQLVGYDASIILGMITKRFRLTQKQANQIKSACRYIIKTYGANEPRVTSAKALLKKIR